MIVACAGNRTDRQGQTPPRFPTEHEPDVRSRIHHALVRLAPRAVVSAAAAGADLIVLQEARRLSIPIHVVLPLPVDRFREVSVADREGWTDAFDETIEAVVADAASTLTLTDLGTDDESFRVANGWIQEQAALLRRGTEPVVAITVRPPDGTSVTDDFAQRATERGWPVVTVDPRSTGPAMLAALDGQLEALLAETA